MQDIVVEIGGMSCGHCLQAVNKALVQIDGIEVKSIQIGRAELRVRDTGATESMKAALGALGYDVQAVTEG